MPLKILIDIEIIIATIPLLEARAEKISSLQQFESNERAGIESNRERASAIEVELDRMGMRSVNVRSSQNMDT